MWRIKELDSIIDGFENDIIQFLNSNNIKRDNDYLNLVLDTAAKSIVSIREVLCLCNCGFPDGALSLARNICEQFFILSYFESVKGTEEFDNSLHDYYLDYDIQRVKKNKNAVERFDESKVEELDYELNELKQKKISKKRGNYWWANVNSFKDLCDVIMCNTEDETKGLIYNLLWGYDRACVSLHASCLGNSVRLIYDKDSKAVDTSPSVKGHSMPLWLSVTSFIWISSVTYSQLGIKVKFNKQFNELAVFYSKKMEEEFKNA